MLAFSKTSQKVIEKLGKKFIKVSSKRVDDFEGCPEELGSESLEKLLNDA